MRTFRLAVVPALLLLAGCGVQQAELEAGDFQLDGSAEGESALATTEIKAATTGITVWMRPYATREVREQQTFFVLRGRASVNLDNAFSYVPDDGFCQSRTLTARTFEIACESASETNSLLSGLPLFVRLDQPGGKSATLKFELQPRFVDASGSSKLWLSTAIKPIYVPEVGLTYRGKLSASSGAITGVVGAQSAKLSLRGTSNDYNVDVSFEALRSAAYLSGATFTLDAEGTRYTKKAAVAFGVGALELARTDDAYQTWPSVSCTSAVQSCLNTAGAAASDYEACGSYRQVSRCNIPSSLPQLGASPDDLSRITAALADINASRPNAPVTVASFYVQAYSSAKPSISQVIKAWQRQDTAAAGATVTVAEQTPGQVNTALDPYQARSLVPAIQQTVYQSSFKASRLMAGTVAYEVLYFPTAARFTVIRLP